MMETEINLPYITADASGPKHLDMKLTRAKFEQMTEDLLNRCREPFEAALKDAGLKASEWMRSCWSAARPACRWSRNWSAS